MEVDDVFDCDECGQSGLTVRLGDGLVGGHSCDICRSCLSRAIELIDQTEGKTNAQ